MVLVVGFKISETFGSMPVIHP